MTARISWLLAAVTFVLVVTDVTVTAQYRHLLSEDAIAVHGFPFVDLAVLGCSVLGALILTQAPRHRVGLLLCMVGITGSISLLAESYSIWVTSENGPGSNDLGGMAGWLSTLLGGQVAIAGLALMFLLAPDGRLISRRWRYAAIVTVVGALLATIAVLTENPLDYNLVTLAEGRGKLATLLASVGFVLIAVGLVASAASMVVRLRRSSGEVRQQVRLIALSAGLIAFGVVALMVLQILNGGHQTWAASVPLFVSYTLLPVLFGIAVLRYRLYDVEVIVNRTLVLALGSAFAAIGYTTLVVVVGKMVGRTTEGLWLSLFATALVALAFQPLRRQVVRLANRLAYGSRAQPYEALHDFSHRLAETPSPATLLPAVARAAGEAVPAAGTAALLRARGGPAVSSEWGRIGSPEEAHRAVVRHGREELGSIQVWSRDGMRLRPSDVRLLEALADQTAVAFYNAGLEAQLAAHVAELDRTTDELARSRARIIEADDEARREMEAAISRDVLPHLAAVPPGIARARAANAAGQVATGLDDLVSTTNTALEALRELTRGLFPTQLTRAGLEPALRSFLARRGSSGVLRSDGEVASARFAAPVEATVYSCTVGALRQFAEVSSVDLFVQDADLVVSVRGTPRRPVDAVAVRAVRDRAEALGGSISSTAGEVVVRVPQSVGQPLAVSAAGLGPEL